MADQDDDLDYFLREMRGVVPMRKNDKANVKTAKKEDAHTLKARREAALQETAEDNNFLSEEYVDLLGPFDPVEYKKDGVQEGVYKRLKQGKYPVDAALNLQKKTVQVCRGEVFQFIEDCYKHDIRVAMITIGRGESADSLPCVVKSYLAKWLPQFPQVIAINSAQKSHGGTGALYVLLKKSERQKAINRDRHIKQGRQPKAS
ncbi:DNA endonuclease SmrA [Oceanospirillum sediminis]|uniref:DNA endonuclease SmrA n=1 Tax=Oceanospirillum sediminis TaxID=2760088 RepID=A0A839IM34_9GAMM|nr:DNA endonuclease SmrA [Oceanospirillum sediminis]MBB1486018.1 DNA endonuclease SmrA [Oceanospirillum sediminis]